MRLIKFFPRQPKSRLLLAAGLFIIFGWSLLFDIQVKFTPSRLAARFARIWPNYSPSSLSPLVPDYSSLAARVIPAAGRTVPVTWGNLGQKLVASGAIDLAKFKQRYQGLDEFQKQALTTDSLTEFTFTPDNIQFWTNVLWALGLTQTSQVLTEGPIQQNTAVTPIKNYASTAGWTLGAKPAMQLFNSTELIPLTKEENQRVYRLAATIFRPCCGNHAAFPDCNHGMAVLGLLELMVNQGATDAEIYRAALAFNSYAFPSTYITAAAYFAEQGIPWQEVNAKEVLGQQYSSGQGANFIAKQVGAIPGAPKRGASCGT